MKILLSLKLKTEIQEYLEKILDGKIELEYLGPLEPDSSQGKKLKDFNYGKSLLLEITLDGNPKSYIMATMEKNQFGHEFFYDRAKSLLLDHHSFNNLPKHVNSIDVGVYTREKEFLPIGNVKEFFILREKAEGKEYVHDLENIREHKIISELDEKRVLALASYLADIHIIKKEDPGLYTRRIRELIGHGECIMGIIDSYPPNLSYINIRQLKEIEKKCVDWRYKLKRKGERLCQVHGDFHPWNILFREGTDFTLLDRSRGEWGEAADDLTAMTLNYLFFALLSEHRISGPFLDLFHLFWETYLRKTGDEEISRFVAPFYAWRALVVASPIWYPDIDETVRRKLFTFIENVINEPNFDHETVDHYFNED